MDEIEMEAMQTEDIEELGKLYTEYMMEEAKLEGKVEKDTKMEEQSSSSAGAARYTEREEEPQAKRSKNEAEMDVNAIIKDPNGHYAWDDVNNMEIPLDEVRAARKEEMGYMKNVKFKVVKKAEAYDIPGLRFRGQDVTDVMEQLREPIERARRGEGPTMVEVMTYRYRGHSMSDPGKYRTAEEVEERKTRDPVRIGRGHALAAGVSEEALAAVDAAVEAEVEDAVRFADESAQPDEALLHTLTLAPNGDADSPPPAGSYPAEKRGPLSADAAPTEVHHA